MMEPQPETPLARAPNQALPAIARLFPDIWRLADRYRAEQACDWPGTCFMPLDGWREVLRQVRKVKQLSDGAIPYMHVAAALGAWRVSQGIYRFDDALYQALVSTRLDGEVPSDVLFHLPEWCVYLETPGLAARGLPMPGFWACLRYETASDPAPKLWLMPNQPEEDDCTFNGLLIGLGGSLRDGLLAARPGIRCTHEHMSQIVDEVQPMLSLLLYLCSENADYARSPRPVPKRTKRGLRLFPPDKIRIWDVGIRIGAQLRNAYASREQAGDGSYTPMGRAPVRPHVRRAHWHTYWRGPKDGDREPTLRWLPPIPVAVTDGDMPAVVHKVVEPEQPKLGMGKR